MQSILVSVLVSFIFRLVGSCSVVLLLIKELGKVKLCTIKDHVFVFSASHLDMPEGYLTFCEGVISSTGTPEKYV